MKKRLTSILLVLVMVAGMCIPASATETGPEDLELIPVENVDTSTTVTLINDDITTEEAMPLELVSASQDEISADAAPYAIRSGAIPQEVHIYPIVLNVTTSEAFIINGISRSKVLPNTAEYETLSLSPDQVQAFLSQIVNALTTSPSTSSYTWALIGWYVKATVLLTAERPRRVETTPAFYPAGTKYETETSSVSSQTAELHLSQEFYFPKDMNIEAYHYVGFKGDFYSIYTSGPYQGDENGIAFSVGVMLNAN